MGRPFQSFRGLLCLAVCLGSMNGADKTPPNLVRPGKQTKDPRVSFVTTPLSFEPNVGQNRSSAKFFTRGPGYNAEISPTQAKFEFPSKDQDAPVRSLSMDLLNAKKDAPLEGESILPGKMNYFPGPDKTKWRSNIPTYARVQETGVYPGIDLAFYGNQKRLEYDFLVQPNANPEQIELKLSGYDSSSPTASGDLAFSIAGRDFRLLKPVAYQLSKDGKTHDPVDASYRLNGSGEVLSWPV